MNEDAIDYITIPVERHHQLESAERKLKALEAAGVDNWEGYDEAMRILYGEDDQEDFFDYPSN